MKLSDYADPRLVVTQIDQGSIGDILKQLVAPLEPVGIVGPSEQVVDALVAREAVMSTGLGSGIAVPHAISSALASPCLVIGICESGVDFKALDDRPVSVFFVLLSPPNHAGHHIRMLARIARLAKNPEFVDALRTSSDPQDVVSHIARYEAEHI